MAIIAELSIQLVGATSFTPPADVPWEAQGSPAAALTEFAGRACYETWNKPNPHTATTDAYIRHILDVGHLTVLEHSSATMYFRGVSRSCSQEIMRHRHFSFSQLSQRYVPAEEARVVVPEEIRRDEGLTDVFLHTADVAHEAYQELLQGISDTLPGESNAVLRYKQARQAARAVLPHCMETRFVMSGNLRSWRHFVGMRAAEHADPEIRRIAVTCLKLLSNHSPELFADFSITTLRDGAEMATSPYVSGV